MSRNIAEEKELKNTLKVIKDYISNSILPLKGMIEQIDKLISKSNDELIQLNKKGDNNAKTNQSSTWIF